MEWAYVAGYFDGEGHVRFKAAPSRPDYVLTSLGWANTHLASLEAIQDFVGAGRIQHKKMKYGYVNVGHQLIVSRVEDVIRIGEQMLPHLIIKHDKVQEMMEFVRENRKAAPESWGALTAVGVDEITRLYHVEGLRQREIAQKFGVSDGAVATFFRRNGIKGRRRGPKEGAYGILAQHGHDKLMAMYESGMTMDEIGQALGVNAKTVYMHFYVRGIRVTRKIRRARNERKKGES